MPIQADKILKPNFAENHLLPKLMTTGDNWESNFGFKILGYS